MTPLHSMIKNALLPVCLETNKARRVATETKPSERAKQLNDYFAKLTTLNESYVEALRQTAMLITGDKGITVKPKDPFVFSPMTVIRFKNGDLRIVTHGTKYYSLRVNGEIGEHTNGLIDGVATDVEVERCLDQLVPKQLRTIMSHEVFMPFIQPMLEDMEEEEEKVSQPVG